MQHDTTIDHLPKLTAGERGLEFLAAHPDDRLTVASVARALGVGRDTLQCHKAFMAAFRKRSTDLDRGMAYLAANPNAQHTLASVAKAIRVNRSTLQRHETFMSALLEHQHAKGSPRCPLARFLETYVAHRPELKPLSVEQLQCSVKAFDRYLERPALLSDFNEETLMRFISWRRQRKSNETTKRNRATLLTLWRFASRQRLIPSPPIEGIQTVKVARRNPIAWTLSEIERILEACSTLQGRMFAESDQKRRKWIKAEYTGPERSKWWSSLILFLYDTGARIGAALKIEPADIDLERGVVTLQSHASKTGLEQVLRLSPQTVAAIRGIYDPKARRVWYWRLSSPPQWTLREILDKAGLPSGRDRLFHCVRKTCASLTAGAGRADLARRTLGHATPTMTEDRYIDKRALKLESAADVLPRPKWSGDDSAMATPPARPSGDAVEALQQLSPAQLEAVLAIAQAFRPATSSPA